MEGITVEQLLIYMAEIGAAVAAVSVIVSGLAKRLDKRIADKLDPIARELQSNGGKSLRDDVRAIRAEVERNAGQLEDATKELAAQNELQAKRHRENAKRLARLERSESSLRRGVLWLFDHARRVVGEQPPPRFELPPPPVDELRRVEEDYRYDSDRPDDPVE